jgi:hypothetical protein
VFSRVKLLNHPIGAVDFFFMGVSKDFGTLGFVYSKRWLSDRWRLSVSFVFLLGGLSLALRASSPFMSFCVSYMSSDMDSRGSLDSVKRKSPF